MAGVTTVDSPDAAASLGRQLYEFDAVARHRGTQHHRLGRVLSVDKIEPDSVAASIADHGETRTMLIREGSTWVGTCSWCKNAWCEHVFAAALAWLEHLAHAAAGLPPVPALDQTTATALAASLNSPRLSFRQQWEPILTEKLGRPLTPDEGVFLGRLANVFHNFRQSRRLHGTEIERLGFRTNEARKPGYGAAFAGWWTTPPRDPMELWQYIATDIETSGLKIPEFLRPVTDTVAIRARLQDRQRLEAVERWNRRLADLARRVTQQAASPAVEEQPKPLELRLCVGAESWALETRADPNAPWQPAPRSFLERFSRPDPTVLAAVETSPAVYAFLALCQDYRRTHYAIDLRPNNVGGRELLHRLLSHRLARTLVLGAGARPLEFSADPLAWRLARTERNPRDYELALQLPDGTPLPPSALHLPGTPDLYLHRNTVYRGPPPLDGNSTAAAIIPAEVIDEPSTLRMLRQAGAKLPPDIEARFLTIPLRARVECALEVDFSGSEILTLNLYACADNPPVERTWTNWGWVDEEGESEEIERGPKGEILSFDLAGPMRVAASLPVLKLGYDTLQKRWVRRVTRAFPEEFLNWRESLPPDVEIRATGELASLLGASVRASVNFELLESEAHRDWFDLALVLKPEDATLTREELALLLKARGKLVRLPGKGWRRLKVELDETSMAALEGAGFDRDTLADAALAGERHRFHALQLAQSAIAERLPQQQADALRARAREIIVPEPPSLPAGLLAKLRPYQEEGFHFLAFLSQNQLGGVLADDMGLGKTVQTLTWLLWLAGRRPANEPLRALVVCPKSVMGNWQAEAAKFTPALAVVRFAPAARDEAAVAAAGGPTIVVANYAQLRINAEFFSSQRWHAVILDEGQFIKTPTSRVAQIARDLPGEHRVVLTGTPIENRLLDLWSLFSFALPGLLGSQAAFKRHYNQENPLALPRLRARVRHFLLRRTKAQVAADLPERTEEDVTVDLEGEQAKLYQAELKRARAQLLQVQTTKQLDKARFNILASLLRLRQICCHPALVDSAHRAAPSAKLEELMERLEELRDEGHQVLVFSQFVEMLELIREKLVAAKIEHLMLTGQTENREALVQEFQTEKRYTVFLLSLKAAGFGLNLTAASYVILYDPWWNPAVEAQAIDRTHRIGQQVPVNAYRLIARGTIEEKIRLLQREKAALAGAIVQEESLTSVLDLDSLRQILA
ncbi:MAG: DEAD/DEAH box helicase [Opitutaceae bacterium]|nr:DEAD/DEAH box helicase [Opitutaceae bacterium]